MLPYSDTKTIQVITFGAQGFKRGAIVGGIEYNIPLDSAVNYPIGDIERDRELAEFLAATLPKGQPPLHHYYVTEVTKKYGDHTPQSFFTISVHVENIAQATELFQLYDDLTLYPLYYNIHDTEVPNV